MKQAGIYEIVNTVNGKQYVGSAIDLAGRQRLHVWNLKRGTHHSKHLQNAWKKYGDDAFTFKTLLLCSRENLVMYEQRAIDGFKPEYNISCIAGSVLGIKRTPEQRVALSAALKGIKYPPRSEDVRAAISRRMIGNKYGVGGKSRLGQKHSPEELIKMAAWVRSSETKAKMSDSAKGHKRWLGKKHSDESRKRISERKRGIPWSDARRRAQKNKAMV